MCPYVRKGQNINGWYYYCDVVAFGLQFTGHELAQIGCTKEKRKTCQRLMELAVGVGLVPQPIDGD